MKSMVNEDHTPYGDQSEEIVFNVNNVNTGGNTGSSRSSNQQYRQTYNPEIGMMSAI